MLFSISGDAEKQMCVKAVTSGNNHVSWEKYKNIRHVLQHQICFLFLFFMLLTLIRGGSGVLTSTPADVAVINGTNFSLRCSTSTTVDLLWYRLSPGAQSEDHIVEGSRVNHKLCSFCSVLHENQTSVLTILAEQSSAARYACVEFSTAERATAQVTVLESAPACSENLTGNVLNLTCVVRFSGYGNPSIKWTQVATKEEKEVTVGTENRQAAGHLTTFTSTLMVRTNESERNQLRVYRYMVKFCARDDVKEMTDGRLCSFSQLLSIGHNLNEHTKSIKMGALKQLWLKATRCESNGKESLLLGRSSPLQKFNISINNYAVKSDIGFFVQ